MHAQKEYGSGLIVLLAALAAPAFATVRIVSMQAAPPSPQTIGTPITFTVTATDSGPGPLTFRFNRAAPEAKPALVRDFNAGTPSGGTWTAQPLVWAPTGPEGVYQVQVVAKDFSTGENDNKTIRFKVNPLATGSTPVAVPTANPLVALFSAPACGAGSSMRVSFRQNAPDSRVTATKWGGLPSRR